MYRAIVAAKVRRAWQSMAAHDHAPVLAQFAPRFTYVFVGDHALGGVRTDRAAQDAWFQRLFRLFPEIEFRLRDVLVAGWPWRTRAVALIDVHVPIDGGYDNQVAQTIEIRWGRITSITTLEDTQKLERALNWLGANGVPEALADPITDDTVAADRVPAATAG